MYSNFTASEKNYIHTKRRNIVTTSLSSRTEPINTFNELDWMTIFEPYLSSQNKYIILNSMSAYYKEQDLTDYYPNNPEGRINGPFNQAPDNSRYKVLFVDTSTNAKIYTYADLLIADERVAWVHLPYADRLLVQHQKHKIKVLKNENTILILTSLFNNRMLKEVTAILPKLFDIEELLQDEKVMNCCKAILDNKDIRPYFEEMFASVNDQEKEEFERLLKESLTITKQKRLRSLQDSVNRTQSEIQYAETSLEALYDKWHQLLSEKLGLESIMKEDPESFKNLSEFISKNPYIKKAYKMYNNIGSGSKDNLIFEFEAPITLYETEPLVRQYNNLKYQISNSKLRWLDVFMEIFSKEKYQLYCTTTVAIDASYPTFTAKSDYIGIDYTDFARMPQPHLTFYNCWGDQSYNIKTSLKEGGLLDALQLMLISIQNVNFTDTAVLHGWLNKIDDYTSLSSLKCIKDTEENWYSFRELYNKMNKEAEEAMINATVLTGEPGVAQPELVDELEGVE